MEPGRLAFAIQDYNQHDVFIQCLNVQTASFVWCTCTSSWFLFVYDSIRNSHSSLSCILTSIEALLERLKRQCVMDILLIVLSVTGKRILLSYHMWLCGYPPVCTIRVYTCHVYTITYPPRPHLSLKCPPLIYLDALQAAAHSTAIS